MFYATDDWRWLDSCSWLTKPEVKRKIKGRLLRVFAGVLNTIGSGERDKFPSVLINRFAVAAFDAIAEELLAAGVLTEKLLMDGVVDLVIGAYRTLMCPYHQAYQRSTFAKYILHGPIADWKGRLLLVDDDVKRRAARRQGVIYPALTKRGLPTKSYQLHKLTGINKKVCADYLNGKTADLSPDNRKKMSEVFPEIAIPK